MSITNNTTLLNSLLEQVNNLPDATSSSGSIAVETGAITCTYEDSDPGTYDIYCDLSAIPNIDEKLVVILIIDSYASTNSPHSCMSVLFRENTSTDFTVCLGTFLRSSLAVGIYDGYTLQLSAADPRDLESLSGVTYYAY